MARGEGGGQPPYGWQLVRDPVNGDRLEVVPEQQEVIREVALLRASGHSYGAIADHLNATGRTTKMGRTWFAMSVRGVMHVAQRFGIPLK